MAKCLEQTKYFAIACCVKLITIIDQSNNAIIHDLFIRYLFPVSSYVFTYDNNIKCIDRFQLLLSLSHSQPVEVELEEGRSDTFDNSLLSGISALSLDSTFLCTYYALFLFCLVLLLVRSCPFFCFWPIFLSIHYW